MKKPWCIVSLLDNDLYKFTMQQAALHHFPSVEAEYKLIIRSKGVDLRPMRREIEDEIDHFCQLKMQQEELDFLGGIRFLKPDYVRFLEDHTMKRRYVTVSEEGENLALRIKGEWVNTILFEVPLLAIIEEVYCRNACAHDENAPTLAAAQHTGQTNLEKKIALLREHPFRLVDFGTRRRFSQQWHEHVVGELKKVIWFDGTSNLHLARRYGLKPVGTMAHEWIQAGQGMPGVQLAFSQKYMLEKWAEEYRGDLGIALTDTIGMDKFLKDFDLYLAKLYDGARHDSNDPIVWGEKMIAHYKAMRIDPMTKIATFSDNLNFEKAIAIDKHFEDRILRTFGIGTFLTNDVGLKPLSIVIKLVRINGNPVAKISDEPEKEVCEDRQFSNYLKKVSGLPYGEFRTVAEYAADVTRREKESKGAFND